MKPKIHTLLVLHLLLSTICIRAADGLLDTSFSSVLFSDGVGGSSSPWVHSAIVQTNGKIVIGGSFSSINGVSRNQIARLNSDGSLDTGFNPVGGANHWVMSTALRPNGKVLIAGYFTTVNGSLRSRIAALNSDGSLDTSFNPISGANGMVWSIVLQADGKVILGGEFTSVNGTSVGRIARLNTDGSLDNTFNPLSGADARVWAVAVQADGKVILGGDFSQVGTNSCNRIARLNSDGSFDAAFNVGSGTDLGNEGFGVGCVAVQSDGKILLGGRFSVVNGVPRSRIARLNADGSVDTTFNPGTGITSGPNNAPTTLVQQPDGKILVGGTFTIYNQIACHNLIRLNVDGSLDVAFDPASGPASSVYSIAIQPDQATVVAGDFSDYSGQPHRNIARIFGVTSLTSGLVAYYPFNGSANDNSGIGNHGTVFNATLTTNRFGIPNSAYDFNGSNSYISVPQNASLDPTANFTFSAWICQRGTVSGGYRILDKLDGATPGVALDTYNCFDGSGHRIRLQGAAINPCNVSGSTDFALQTWHHVVATVSGNVGRIYLDGNLEGVGDVGNIPHNALNILIGRAHPYGGAGNVEWFNGIIDDVRIYNRTLTASEILQLYSESSGFSSSQGLNTGLIAYYPFNGNANDNSGNGNNGIPYFATPTTNRFGVANSAFLFNGSSSVVDVSNIFPMQGEQTFAVWVNPSSETSYQPIIEKAIPGFGGEVDFQLRLPINGVDGTVNWIVNTEDGSTGTFAGAFGHTTLPVGQWSFLACVINQANNQIRLYVNGVLDATGSMGGRNVRNRNYPFRIGRQSGNQGNFSFDGGIDDIRIYNRALSGVEIQQLYAYIPPPTPQPAPPTSTATTQIPTTNLTARPRVPGTTSFRTFTSGAFATGVPLDTNKMTIVLTHGWRSSSADWPSTMAAALVINGFSANANIVAWDWSEDAQSWWPSFAKARTAANGEALGAELFYLLGLNYQKPIHFMGHSFGTLVNCRAADYLHGDNKNSPAKLVSPTFKFDAQRTHMTLFDEAGLANFLPDNGKRQP